MNHYPYRTAFGRMTICSDGVSVVQVVFGDAVLGGERMPSAITNLCANQLMEYFSGKRMVFDLPIDMQGSEFQLSVWHSLIDIPYGQTRTPKEIAAQIGSPSSYRLISKAACSTALPVIVPLHRLVSANGRDSGHMRGADLRRACRELEKRFM